MAFCVLAPVPSPKTQVHVTGCVAQGPATRSPAKLTAPPTMPCPGAEAEQVGFQTKMVPFFWQGTPLMVMMQVQL